MIQAVVCAALGLTAMSAFAAKDGYLTDSRDTVVRDNYNECWHTNYWTKENAVEGCDGFVAKKPEAPKVVEAPTPVTPTPTPTPVVPAPPKKVETISLNASGLFDFNKATLKEEGKQSLGSVAGVLLERKYDASKTKIIVVGHTDRIGSASYNQKLSEERAASARNYIVSKGVPENLITSSGKGETEPVTKPEDCKKVLKNRKKLIACYAPDRRVDIEIYASVVAQ